MAVLTGYQIKKLKGIALIESLIAAVVAFIAIGLGTMIYANVLSSHDHTRKQDAALLAEKMVWDNKTNMSEPFKVIETDVYTITLSKMPYPGYEGISLLITEVADKAEQKLVTRKELIYED